MPITLSSPFNYKKSNGSYINCLPFYYNSATVTTIPLSASIIQNNSDITIILTGNGYYENQEIELNNPYNIYSGPSIISTIQNISSNTLFAYPVTFLQEPNLRPENIKSGVSIYGIQGTFVVADYEKQFIEDGPISYDKIIELGFSDCDIIAKDGLSFPVSLQYKISQLQSIISKIGCSTFFSRTNIYSISFPVCSYIGEYAFTNCRYLSSISFPKCNYIGKYAFQSCSNLTSINFPECSYIGTLAFGSCSNLTTVSFPECNYIGDWAFQYCSNLTSVSFPKCSYIGRNAFYNCSKLTTVSFPVCSYIGSYAFQYCSNLTTIYLDQTLSVCNLLSSNAFTNCSKLTSIYVPNSLITAYKNHSVWSYYSNKIKGV